MRFVPQRYNVDGNGTFQTIVMPQFGDVLDENGDVMITSAEEGDWTVMDDVPYKETLFELFGSRNLLKRRDATCKIIRSSLGRVGARYITTEKLYIAAENCQQELYRGAFRDWESRSDVFQERALEIIQRAAGDDIFSNKWFGKESRIANANWSLNKFNGIFFWINQAIADGTIPAGQTLTIPDGEITDADAYALLADMVDSQDDILYNSDDADKAIYCDKKLAKKAWRYLVSIGQATPAQKAQGMPATFTIEDIEVRTQKWAPILTELGGDAFTYAAVLTFKGNFVFATDTKYGKGPNNAGPALSVWYSQDDDVTRWELHLKAGTQLGYAKHAVVALSNGLTAVL